MDQKIVRGKRILLVDDERDIRTAAKMLLEYDEHEVIEAPGADQALELFRKEPFDLVITDFRMTGMNGGELAACIRKLAPSTPILMITGFHEDVPPGAVDAIVDKPFTLEQLRSEIARLVG